MNQWAEVFTKILKHPRYLSGIEYGNPRRGHAEGSVKNHILQLETNLEILLKNNVVVIDTDYYWKLKILIHVHDTFKGEAQRGAPIDDLRSHASIARFFFGQFAHDQDMACILQYHDLGFAIYKKLQATRPQKLEEVKIASIERVRTCIGKIDDKNLFLLFCLIDTCTPSKGREKIKWWVGLVFMLYMEEELFVNVPFVDFFPLPEVNEFTANSMKGVF